MPNVSHKKKRREEEKTFSMSEEELTLALLTNELTWKEISRKNLSIDFIDRCKDNLCWDLVSKYTKLSSNFIDKYSDYVDWSTVCKKGYVDDYIFDKYFIELYTNELFVILFNNPFATFNCSILEKYVDYFDEAIFGVISTYSNLTEDFIIKYSDKLNWASLSMWQYLSENIVSRYFSKIDFNLMNYSVGCKLSSEYISKYILNKLSYQKIIKELNDNYSKINFKMIEKINDQKLWDLISEQYDHFTAGLIRQYKHKLNKQKIRYNFMAVTTKEVIEELNK